MQTNRKARQKLIVLTKIAKSILTEERLAKVLEELGLVEWDVAVKEEVLELPEGHLFLGSGQVPAAPEQCFFGRTVHHADGS